MKTFYKISISLVLVAFCMIAASFPSSPLAYAGEHVFGDYYTYIGTLATIMFTTLMVIIIVAIWDNL